MRLKKIASVEEDNQFDSSKNNATLIEFMHLYLHDISNEISYIDGNFQSIVHFNEEKNTTKMTDTRTNALVLKERKKERDMFTVTMRSKCILWCKNPSSEW